MNRKPKKKKVKNKKKEVKRIRMAKISEDNIYSYSDIYHKHAYFFPHDLEELEL